MVPLIVAPKHYALVCNSNPNPDLTALKCLINLLVIPKDRKILGGVRTKLKPGQALRGRLGLRKAEALGTPAGSVAKPIRKIPVAPGRHQTRANPDRDARF